MEQRTEEWIQARLGKVTASRVADVMARTKSGYSASRKNYMAELVCERLTGTPSEHFESAAMKWGTDTEPLARSAYEARTGELVEEVGFIEHPRIPNFGASPDGLVGADGGLEIKCPNTATHIEILLSGGIDSRYIYQLSTGLACTGRKWWDYVSFDPRLPDNLAYKCVRFYRDDALIAEIESEVIRFLEELDAMTERLKGL